MPCVLNKMLRFFLSTVDSQENMIEQMIVILGFFVKNIKTCYFAERCYISRSNYEHKACQLSSHSDSAI